MWTTVHREISPWDAHIVAGRLAAEGLNPFLHSAQHVGVNWPFSLALGMVRVQVPAAEADQARQVLQAWRDGAYDAALADELALPGDVRCPRCDGYHWRPVRSGWSRAVSVACLFYFGGSGFPPSPIGRRCGGCGGRQSLAVVDGGPAA